MRGPLTGNAACVVVLASPLACGGGGPGGFARGGPQVPCADAGSFDVEPLRSPGHWEGRPLLQHPEDWGDDSGLDHTTGLVFSPDDSNLDDFSGGFAALDCDMDGDADLVFTSGDGANALYRNRGDGTFEADPEAGVARPGDATAGASVADFDRDLDPDLLLLTQFGLNRLLRNDGDCRFDDVTEASGLLDLHRSLHAAWADLDGNGWLDLYVGNWGDAVPIELEETVPNTPEPDRLWLSAGPGGFVDMSDQLPADLKVNFAMTTGFLDFDRDGDLDLFQTNDKGATGVPNRLFRNDGISTEGLDLVDVSAESGFDLVIDGMGLAFGDLDLDGDADAVNTGTFETVFLSSGTTWIDSGAALGITDGGVQNSSWGVVAFDPDADIDEDVFFVRSAFFDEGPGGPGQYGDKAMLFTNELPEGGQFVRQEGEGLLATVQTWRSVVAVDVSGDGFQDIVIAAASGPSMLLLANPPQGRGAVEVRLRGTVSDTEGRGAVVTLDVGDVRQTRWPGAVESYSTGRPTWMSFGLGDAGLAGPLDVLWPSGVTQRVCEVHPGERITLAEPEE